MKELAAFCHKLENLSSVEDRHLLVADFLNSIPPEDATWALYFLIGRSLKRLVTAKNLQQWILTLTGFPTWLYDACYGQVGDTAETVTLLLENYKKDTSFSIAQTQLKSPSPDYLSLHHWMSDFFLPLFSLDEASRASRVTQEWNTLNQSETRLFNQLLLGSFRIKLPQTTVIQAVARLACVPETLIACRLAGEWSPSGDFFQRLMMPDAQDGALSEPYASAMPQSLDIDSISHALGDPVDWYIEWKQEGLRAQLIRRGGEVFIWSQNKELLTGQFPELAGAAVALPDGTVLDGHIIALDQGQPAPVSGLQKRLKRKKVTSGLISETPVVYIAWDVLEYRREDIRRQAFIRRRKILEQLLTGHSDLPVNLLTPSALLSPKSYETLHQLWREARQHYAEGLIMKRKSSAYPDSHRQDDWYTWNAESYSVDAVLLYAQASQGGNLLNEYTLALRDDDSRQFIPITKTGLGLSNGEIERLDQWIRAHTLDRFGPVHAVVPHQVFEVTFDAITPSPRHKSGLSIRFPRIRQWRPDKLPEETNRLSDLHRLLQS